MSHRLSFPFIAGRSASAWVVLAHACFVATMAGCYALEPSTAAVRLGLSYYGNHLTTIGPYVTGFGLCIALTVVGLTRLRPRDAATRRFRKGVGLVTVLMLPIPLTPYSIDAVFDWLHFGAVAILFIAGYALGCWLMLVERADRISLGLFLLQTLSALSIGAAQFGLNDYMIPCELTFQIVLVTLVVRHIRALEQTGARRRPVRPT